MCDALLEYTVGGKADRVQETLGFQIFVYLRRGEGGVAPEIQPYLLTLVANDNRLQHAFPVIGTVNVAGTQGTPFKVAELVKEEKGMIAGASEVSVVGRALLFAMGRADAAVHVEDNHLRRAAVVHPVDPNAGQVA